MFFSETRAMLRSIEDSSSEDRAYRIKDNPQNHVAATEMKCRLHHVGSFDSISGLFLSAGIAPRLPNLLS